MAKEIKLLGTWASPFSHRIELALKLKGLQFHYLEEDLSNKSQLLLQSNPVHRKIPVLIHNGNPISESLVIMEYIDEVLWTAFKAYNDKGKEQEDAIEEFSQQLKFLEGELKGKEYFGGERFGFVDIAAFFILQFLTVLQEVKEAELMTEEKYPVLFEWMEKLQGNEVVAGCLPPREKHVAYVRARRAAAEEAASKTKAA
ncbi:unnamed protein product [Linum tenue]|uniref:Glutathione S-transferase n=1 Tax=Linum tenue TaxID=586396 RepID=A0AAV0Q692_9ROSI|nr:unnamed protein product [Linum tenue]